MHADEHATGTMYAAVFPDRIQLLPGGATSIAVRVTNRHHLPDIFHLEFGGVDAEVTMAAPALDLPSQASDSVEIRVRLPESTMRGDHTAHVRITSTRTGSVLDVPVSILAAYRPQLAVRLEPSEVSGKRRATVSMVVRNDGNTVAVVRPDAEVTDRSVTVAIRPPTLDIGPEQEATFTVDVVGKRPWIGSPRARRISLAAIAHERTDVELTFLQRARLLG